MVDVTENPQKAYLKVYTFSQISKRLGERYIWIKELGNKTRKLSPTLVDEEEGMKQLLELAKKLNE